MVRKGCGKVRENSPKYAEYMANVADVLSAPCIQRLDDFMQHMGTTRLSHSINVSYKSYALARLFGWDYRAAARAGLMHDMFYYNFKETGYSAREHCRLHPEIAYRNAKRNFTLTKLEGDIIRSHMWLATWTPPRHREGYLVTMVDKYCAVEEFFAGLLRKIVKPAAV
ncbi:MAG: hydrolase [Oscillospiraceae bacterium]|nr:hydrolase [Oscillospiraceae bacterium]